MPLDHGSETKPPESEQEQCFAAELSILPSCASGCYQDAVRSAGCNADDRCYCWKTSEIVFDYYLDTCLSWACEFEDYRMANEFLSRGIFS